MRRSRYWLVSLLVLASAETKAKDPVIDVKAKEIANVHHRPKVANYPEVSSIMQKYIQVALEKKMAAKAALDQAVKEIETLK